MDGSKRKSDAAATRKRRSSILKSQRAPRTPFSELEFNVATPTDAKSRRVSFSRRNGVAEFEITEATTAWKNVYEEHNKSLESSVNDSESRGERRPLVPHLSTRSALMFEDVEADVVVASSRELVTSFSAAREHTNEEQSISAPRRQFDLSECTHQPTEQLFGDPNPMREITGQMDLNFSSMMPLSDQDLDCIQDRKSNRMSFIDADLNETHISMKGNDSEVSDMSITDTIHSPKVAATEVKSDGKDWVVDKENVIVNPYVAPLPAENFAVTDDDDVLVFDGKKCKFQSDLNSDPEPFTAPVNKSSNKRRTIVYNDDDCDISMTQAVSAQIIIPPKNLNSTRMNATVFESNISMTEAIPSNMIISSKEDVKQQTINLNDKADVTVTETVPSRLLDDKKDQRRKTIVYDANEGQISMTEAVPANIFVSEIPERRKTILYQDDEGDISMTQAVPVNIMQTNNEMVKNKTIVFDDALELEMTQAVPVNVLLTNKSEKRKTIHFDNDGNMSITQAIPTNIVRPEDSNVTETNINCKNKDNVQLNSTNFEARLQHLRSRVIESQESIVADVNRLCSEGRLIETDKETSSKRRTIVFNNDQGNVSITQPLPSNILNPVPVLNMSADCVETIADITEAVPTNIIIDPTKKDESLITIPDIVEDISINKTAVIEKDIIPQLNHSATTHSIIVPKEYGDKSITHAVSNISNKNNTFSNNDMCNISRTNLTNPIPAEMKFIESDLVNKTNDEKLDADNSKPALDICDPGPQSIIVYEATITLEKTDVIVNNSVEFSSNEAQPTSSESNVAGTLQNVPEPMEDGCIGSSSPSNESIVEIRDVSLTKATEEVKPNVQSSVLNDLLDVSMHSFKSENKVTIKETIKVEEDGPLDEIREASSTKAMEEDKPNVPASVNEWLDMPMMEIHNDSSTKVAEVKPIVVQASVLNDLLDMSHASMDDDQEPANNIDMSMKNSPEPSLGNVSIKNKESQETYFIIKDSDSEPVQDSESRKSLTHQPLPIEFEHDKPTVVDELKAGLGKLKQFISFKQARRQSKSPNKNKTELAHETIVGTPPSKKETNKTLIDANDTKGILDILSQLTESRMSNNFTHEDDKEIGPVGTLSSPALKNLAIEDKTDATQARRSMVPDRKSMVRSREDLLKDISMAQALLDDKEEEPEDMVDDTELEASLERANDVVKKLRFDDEESLREVQSPLKKTAFLEAAHSPDGKAKVIPEYMTFTNDLKDLMNDLTKPMADVDRSREERQEPCPCKSASTCSTQIQANLLTSSQIDLMPEQDSSESMQPLHLISGVAEYGNKATHALHNDISEIDSSYAGMRPMSHDHGRHHPSTDRVVIFDHSNPLNNVLLPPIEDSDVHSYNPRPSTASLSVSAKSATTLIPDSQRNVESRLVLEQVDVPFREAFSESVRHSIGHTANRKPPSVDQSVGAAYLDLKDSEVNTVIAMKKNDELLDASSSLTLVDDTMESSNDSYSPSPEKERSRSPEKERSPSPQKERSPSPQKERSPSPQKERSPSPQKEHSVRVLYPVAEDIALISDRPDLPGDESTTQAKKRVYSPANRGNKHCTFPQEVTPKPASKIQKVSDSPSDRKNSAQSNSPEIKARKKLDTTVAQNDVSIRVNETSQKSMFERSQTLCLAHELVTDLNIGKNEPLATLPHQIPPTLTSQSDMSEKSLGNSLAKSKSVVSDSSYLEVVSSGVGSPDRQSDPLNATSSKNLASECDSGVNVVAKIDVLPFMGTSECEWETHGLDTWLIKLLRRRVRLLIRLEHRHGNAARTHVRADTPVREAAVQPVQYDGGDPIPALCVRFATEAIRRVVSEGCARAGDVPALLRRCAAVARVALRWARAMHAAHAHLAFTLQPDGRVSLKVANIPLRSVWEVTMCIELVSARDEPPAPLVLDARAARVVSEHAVPPAELARLLAPLPRDWGHAPRALWKIFKYLKHKKADDELIAIQSNRTLKTRVH